MTPVSSSIARSAALLALFSCSVATGAQELPCPDPSSPALASLNGYYNINPAHDGGVEIHYIQLAINASFYQWVSGEGNTTLCDDTAAFSFVGAQVLQVCKQEIAAGEGSGGLTYGLHFLEDYSCRLGVHSVADDRVVLKAVVTLSFPYTIGQSPHPVPQVLSVWRDTQYPLEQREFEFGQTPTSTAATSGSTPIGSPAPTSSPVPPGPIEELASWTDTYTHQAAAAG